MSDDAYVERVALALEGLMPIVWIDMLGRCENPRKPTVDEVMPSAEERTKLLDTLMLADVFACGDTSRGGSKKAAQAKPSALAAVAKSLAALACCPGGVKFLGTRWVVNFETGQLVGEPTAKKQATPPEPPVPIELTI